MATDATTEPVTLVIFGGQGDLAHRKLLPAVYNLHLDGLLPSPFLVVGTGRKALSDEKYREFARDGVEKYSRRPFDQEAWTTFAKALHFTTAVIDGTDPLATLGSKLDALEHQAGLPGNRIYYLALPPPMFVPAIKQLARARFVAKGDRRPFARVIVEKPLGRDLTSAMAINDALAAVFDETQIFRIDHYLGKETVQNILVLRFANTFFEPLLNHHFVDHVQITVAESEGVGGRAGYYEQAGALRDIVQNHLLQVLALVAMEPPRSLDAEVVRTEKLEVIRSLRPLAGTDVDTLTVRGQYAAGQIEGEEARGYRDESGVSQASATETYVALEAFIDNWRWAGVPFFLRTGKRLPKRASEITIHMKDVPPILFNVSKALAPNVLNIRIQPDEGFALKISSKVPGPHVEINPVEMDFDYSRVFGATSPEAYERLLLEVMTGDATLFMRRDAVEASWRWITPILERWAEHEERPATYAAGSWGPDAAERLIGSTGRRWHCP